MRSSGMASKNVKTVSYAKLITANMTPDEVEAYEKKVKEGAGFRPGTPIHREELLYVIKLSQRRAGK